MPISPVAGELDGFLKVDDDEGNIIATVAVRKLSDLPLSDGNRAEIVGWICKLIDFPEGRPVEDPDFAEVGEPTAAEVEEKRQHQIRDEEIGRNHRARARRETVMRDMADRITGPAVAKRVWHTREELERIYPAMSSSSIDQMISYGAEMLRSDERRDLHG